MRRKYLYLFFLGNKLFGGSYIFAKLDITFNSILKPCQAKPAALKSLELCLESGQAFLVQAASKEEPGPSINIFETNHGAGLLEDFIFSSSITFVQAITVLRHPAAAMEL